MPIITPILIFVTTIYVIMITVIICMTYCSATQLLHFSSTLFQLQE
jgi:hypothetical protein